MGREPWDGDDWGEEESDLGDDLGEDSDPPEMPPAAPIPAPGPPQGLRRASPAPVRTSPAPAAPSPSGRPRRLKVKPMSAGMRSRWPDVTSCLLTLTSGQQVIFIRG